VVFGASALIVRQAAVRGVQVIGAVILARLLSPTDFGVYAIVSFAVTFFGLISDGGLGAALIQARAAPTEHALRIVFTAQLALGGLVAAAAFVTAEGIVRAYGLEPEFAWLVRLVSLGLVISAFRTIPQIRLERELEFARLSVIDTLQAVVFQVVAILFAVEHLGAWSFGLAAVISAVAAAVGANVIAPWRPRLAWSAAILRRLLTFGVPYQGSALVSFLKDAVNPIFIGSALGVVAVGYVNWATLVNSYPVIAIALLNRLYFPVFSRLRDRPEALAPFVQGIVRWNTFVATGIALPFLVVAPYWTEFIFGRQWLPAVPLLYLLVVGLPIGAAASPGLAVLNAFGRTSETFLFTAMWMVLTWILTVPFVAMFGLIGFGLANILVVATTALFYWRVDKVLYLGAAPSLWRVAVASGVALAIGVLLQHVLGSDEGLVPMLVSAATVVTYVASWLLLSWRGAASDVQRVMSAVRANRAPSQ
jgi:O-antigen/teichoic acid export membrane protein